MSDDLGNFVGAEHRPSLSDREFERQLVSHVPRFRRYARSLVWNPQDADDLLQQACLQAWKGRENFAADTNMGAWLSRIIRNVSFDQKRATHLNINVEDCADHPALSEPASQEAAWALNELERALAQLPANQREALLLVGRDGLSYEAAAEQANVPIGTIRSRVGRGRASLQFMIDTARGS